MIEFEVRTAQPQDWEVIADFNSRLAAETEGKTLQPEVILSLIHI